MTNLNIFQNSKNKLEDKNPLYNSYEMLIISVVTVACPMVM